MQNTHHEVVDIERWIELYPLETFENEETERAPICPPEANDEQKRAWQYLYGDSQCLEKAEGQIIVSPADLAMIEQVRQRASQTHSLGKAVPTDIFLLGVGEPEAPCLTKVGGIPYRPADKPWPRANDGTPLSFFLQFCFLDSKDLVPSNLPGDVMLLFVRNWDSLTKPAETDSYRIEWSRIPLHNPVAAGQCPEQPIAAPKYYGISTEPMNIPKVKVSSNRKATSRTGSLQRRRQLELVETPGSYNTITIHANKARRCSARSIAST